ncbi:hypothetical protein [Lusitaniella coriacea]|uniref:hypothetical protein n=1 Tax=Lusitaniella coriacea TaxID=1983105 RepID=UPI003CF6D723
MNEPEQRLKALIDALQQYKRGSLTWRKALNQLILEIQHLPGLAKSSHPDYYEVLDDTFMRLADEIEDFEPQHSSLTTSLVAWINGKLRLKYAVRDLHNPNRIKQTTLRKTPQREFREQGRKTPLSLDVSLSRDSSDTFAERLSSPSLWELQAQIERDMQQQKNIRIGIKLKQYLEEDPDGILRKCHPGDYPRCHCQVLSQRLLLKIPPDKLTTLAKEFEINYNTLNWHWKNKGLPLLQSVVLDFGYRRNSEL